MDAKRFEVSLSQDKINFINSAFQKELDYWKEAALKNLSGNEANQLRDSAPVSLLLTCKAKNNAKKVNINEIIFYLKSQYSTNNRDPVVLVQISSFEGKQEELKIISKHIKDVENMSLRNKTFGGWIVVARMLYKRDKLIEGNNLSQRFDY